MSIISTLKTDNGDVSILGYVVWWNLREVEVTQDWFKVKLDSIGLDGNRYAKSHNYRSTFIRCLRQLEQNRIIRKVTEDYEKLVYQFTAEKLNDEDPENIVLDYQRESVIEIDKEIYEIKGDFNAAITKCNEEIRPVIVDLFNKEKVTYHSNDINRYIQNIFNDYADLVSLRPQGSVYFVPSSYGILVSNIASILATVPFGNASLDYFPVPDVSNVRNAVSAGVESEIIDLFAKMEDEISAMKSGSKDITDKWVQLRRNRLDGIKKRIDKYAEILGNTAEKLNGKFDAIKATLKIRTIEV